ncbi:MAG: hypothetical protein ACOC1R_00400 [Tangfeifania sp.]
MKELVIILFTLSLMALPLQLALLKRRKIIFAAILFTGAYAYLMHTKAIEQSYAQFEHQLADTTLTGNLLVIQVIESIGGILLSIYLLNLHHGEWIKKGFRFFKYVPGIMPFIALFYLESYLFLIVHGMKFHHLGLILAVGFMIALWGGMHLFRWLLRDYDILLEMKFFLHIIQMIVALIISVHLFGLQVPKQTAYLSFQQTGIVLGAGLIIVAMGIFYYHFKVNRLIKK